MISPVVIHIPHSSTWIPEPYRDTFLLDDAELQRELIRMTDHATEHIFAGTADEHVRVVFQVSRLLVDSERFADDAAEPMTKRGMGVLYTHTADGCLMRKPLAPAERQALLDDWYYPHHVRLQDAVKASLDRHGHCLIIDGHSFPSAPLPCDLDQAKVRPDICIGTDGYHTPRWLSESAVAYFQSAGFSVAVDRPYAGALVPMAYYRQTRQVLALMIEVNRSLYSDEVTGTAHDGLERVCTVVQDWIGYVAALSITFREA